MLVPSRASASKSSFPFRSRHVPCLELAPLDIWTHFESQDGRPMIRFDADNMDSVTSTSLSPCHLGGNALFGLSAQRFRAGTGFQVFRRHRLRLSALNWG
jgi:hypothetical protein